MPNASAKRPFSEIFLRLRPIRKHQRVASSKAFPFEKVLSSAESLSILHLGDSAMLRDFPCSGHL